MLSIGIERHYHGCARIGHQAVAGPKRGATAAVDHVPGDGCAVGTRDVAGPVARTVIDHKDGRLGPANPLGDPGQDLGEAALLVVCGYYDSHLAFEMTREIF